jgi:hypothetical protein
LHTTQVIPKEASKKINAGSTMPPDLPCATRHADSVESHLTVLPPPPSDARERCWPAARFHQHSLGATPGNFNHPRPLCSDRIERSHTFLDAIHRSWAAISVSPSSSSQESLEQNTVTTGVPSPHPVIKSHRGVADPPNSLPTNWNSLAWISAGVRQRQRKPPKQRRADTAGESTNHICSSSPSTQFNFSKCCLDASQWYEFKKKWYIRNQRYFYGDCSC